MTGSDTSDQQSPPGGDVRLVMPGDLDYRPGLALVLTSRAVVDASADRQIVGLKTLARRQGLGLDLLSGGYVRNRLAFAALAIESPGRTAMVYMPGKPDRTAARDLGSAVLQVLCKAAFAKGVALLQALTPPEDTVQPKLLQQAGFAYLTELIYMDRLLSRRIKARSGTGDLRFLTYSDAARGLFEQAVEATYIDSLDCPALTGLRALEDVLESHRATGVYDPAGWYVALQGATPVGVMLTAKVTNRSALEVVYMGVCAAARGQGVGHRLMERCLTRAAEIGVEAVTLAVDATNAPARRLYTHWGFDEMARRRAWIASALPIG